MENIDVEEIVIELSEGPEINLAEDQMTFGKIK